MLLRGILLGALSLLTLTACPAPGANEGEGDVSEGEGDVSEGEGDVEGCADVSAAPADCEFGDVVVGSTDDCDVVISNNGSCDVVIDRVAVGQAADGAVVFSTSAVAPLALRAGESVTVGVAAEAVAAGAANGLLRVELDDGEVVVVDLTASGFERTDEFLVQLTWVGDVDVDLHLASPETGWCGEDDLWAEAPSRLWGSSARWRADGAREDIIVTGAFDGDFTAGVGLRDAVGSAQVTVKLFVSGQLEFEQLHELEAGQQWLPVRVHVFEGNARVDVLDDSSAQAGACWSN